MSYRTHYSSKATPFQLRKIRYLEAEVDAPTRIHPNILASLNQGEAGRLISTLYKELKAKDLKKQVALF